MNHAEIVRDHDGPLYIEVICECGKVIHIRLRKEWLKMIEIGDRFNQDKIKDKLYD